MNKHGHIAIGIKDGVAVYVSDTLMAQKDIREIKEALGMIKRYPVKTDLSGNVVMVEGDSHEDAVQRYLAHQCQCLTLGPDYCTVHAACFLTRSRRQNRRIFWRYMSKPPPILPQRGAPKHIRHKASGPSVEI